MKKTASRQDSLTDSLYKLKDVHNYNKWIFENISEGVGHNIIEFGCGLGNITDFLVKEGNKVTAVDINEEFVKYAAKKYAGNKNVKVMKMDLLKPDKKIKSAGYDTAILLNVLEHIKDDAGAVRNAASVLGPKGKFLVLVPALQGIYGTMDRAVGHYKRYEKAGLKKLMEDNGFEVKKIFYLNSIGVFGWFINGRILNRKDISSRQAMIFDRIILPFIKPLERFVKPFFGQSLVVIAEKK
jgi:SAM-dependent methyltransferase